MHAPPSRPKPAGRRTLTLAAATAVLLVAAGLFGRDLLVGPAGPVLAPPVQAATVSPSPPAPPPPRPGTRAFATFGGVVLYLPSRHPVLIGYHEAFYRDALALTPLGRCRHDYNRTRFRVPRPTRGPAYMVMSSRGRRTAATSAADVALHTNATVLSPVTGFVSRIQRYRLYGAIPDLQLTLTEDGGPGYMVLLIHIAHLRVQVGSPLVAGTTPLGAVRNLPFESQVNDYVGAHIQHVHIEVKRVGSSR